MTNKAEKLRERMGEIVCEGCPILTQCQASISSLCYDYPKTIERILQECKDAGLKFTKTGVVGDDIEGACLCKVEEIEV